MDEPPRSCLPIKRTVIDENLFEDIKELPDRFFCAQRGEIRLRL